MEILFYLFSGILIACAVAVVCARNTLYSVLFLIMAFFNTGGLFLLIGAEFLAMILVIVYVGAVAVLFLFVVMMLDLSQTQPSQQLNRYRWGSIGTACVFGFELIMVAFQWTHASRTVDRVAFPLPKYVGNTEALGELLYTHYFYVFQISGLILLTAMIGAIVLTLPGESRRFLRKQNVKDQLRRTKKDSLTLKKIDFRQGIT